MDVRTNPPVCAETIDDVTQLIQRLELLFTRMDEIDAFSAAQCAPILRKAARQFGPIRREALSIARTLDGYARRHKKELTENGTKSKVKLPGGGQFWWSKTRPAVQLKDEEETLQFLLQRGMEEFIRRTPSINRLALIEHWIKANRIPGVKVEPNRRFVIVPPRNKRRLERRLNTRTFKIVKSRSSE